GPARAEQEFRLQLPLGQALMVTQAFASPEAAQAFARARVLSAKLDDPVQVVLLLYGLFSSVRTRDGPQAAQPLADQALAAAEQAGRAGRPAERANVETHAAWLHVLLREPAAAREHAKRAACAEEEGMARSSGTLMIFRGWALAEEGHTQEGLAAVRAGLERIIASGQRLARE